MLSFFLSILCIQFSFIHSYKYHLLSPPQHWSFFIFRCVSSMVAEWSFRGNKDWCHNDNYNHSCQVLEAWRCHCVAHFKHSCKDKTWFVGYQEVLNDQYKLKNPFTNWAIDNKIYVKELHENWLPNPSNFVEETRDGQRGLVFLDLQNSFFILTATCHVIQKCIGHWCCYLKRGSTAESLC